MLDKYDVFGFDLFGTLVERKKNKFVYEKIISFLDSKNLDCKNIFYLWKTQNKTLSKIINDLIDLNNKEKQELKYLESLILEEVYGTNIKSYTKELFDLLKENDKKIFLISNLGRPYEKVLKKYDLYKYFDFKVLSYEVGFIKPDKDIYLPAKERYKDKNIIFSGDNEKPDILGPKSVGMDAMFIDDLVDILLKK